MRQSVLQRRHSEFILENVYKVLCRDESHVDGKLRQVDVGALEQCAGMAQSQVAHQFRRSLLRDGLDAVEEGHSSHAHCRRHLFEVDLSATHVLHHILFHVVYELLVHGVVHRVFADGLSPAVVFHSRSLRQVFLLFLSRLVARLCLGLDTLGQCLYLSLHLARHVVVVDGGCGHTCVVSLQSSCLLSLNQSAHVDVHLQSEQSVESHCCLLHVKRFGEIVVSRHGDVSLLHLGCTQHTVGHQHKLYVLGALVCLDIVAQFATRHLWHNLLTYHDVRFEHLQVGVSLRGVVVCMYGVNLSQMSSDEIEEVLVVIHDSHHIFLSFQFLLRRTYGSRQLSRFTQQFHLSTVVQLKSVGSKGSSLRLGIVQIHLHL